MTVLYSPRKIPLVWQGGHPAEGEASVLTVECHSKWYVLMLVTPTRVEEIHYGHLWPETFTRGEPSNCDHAPNPRAVQRFAFASGYQLCALALELMIGRWELEYHESYEHVIKDDA